LDCLIHLSLESLHRKQLPGLLMQQEPQEELLLMQQELQAVLLLIRQELQAVLLLMQQDR